MKRFIMLVVIIGLMGSIPLLAQDYEDPTVGDITGDLDVYRGDMVTLEGNVADLVNVRAFEFTEDELFGGGRVMIVIVGDETFSLALSDGRSVRVTGQVYGQIVDEDDNGLVDFVERDLGSPFTDDEEGFIEEDEALLGDDSSAEDLPDEIAPNGELDPNAVMTETGSSVLMATERATGLTPTEVPTDETTVADDGTPPAESVSVAEVVSSFPVQEYDEIVVIRVSSPDDIVFTDEFGS